MFRRFHSTRTRTFLELGPATRYNADQTQIHVKSYGFTLTAQ
jgi:hypothetical protein